MAEHYDFGMPLSEAMETQRAIRRLKPDPVDDGLVLRLIELALKSDDLAVARRALDINMHRRKY